MSGTYSGVGRVGRDPEARSVGSSGSEVTTVAICCQPYKSEPIWIRASVWGSAGKYIQDNVVKGDQVHFSGTLKKTIYKEKEYFELDAKFLELCGKKSGALPTKSDQLPKETRNQYRKQHDQTITKTVVSNGFTGESKPEKIFTTDGIDVDEIPF